MAAMVTRLPASLPSRPRRLGSGFLARRGRLGTDSVMADSMSGLLVLLLLGFERGADRLRECAVVEGVMVPPCIWYL